MHARAAFAAIALEAASIVVGRTRVLGHLTPIANHHSLDRPLQHIKAKGRPVSQCNHCRSERKNRSAHVKCQCGKRASEGGSGKGSNSQRWASIRPLTASTDCGCFSGQKCRCATKKSPKQEAKKLGDISEHLSDLASPASTLNTASPAQPSIGTDLPWSDASTPASNFTSLDGLPQFDSSAWISNPPLDNGFGVGGTLDTSALGTIPTTGVDEGLLSLDHQQQFAMDMPDFGNMSDWPAMDDEATKQLLAMMDTPAGVDLGGFDVGSFSMNGNDKADANFGLEFPAAGQQQILTHPDTSNSNGSKCHSKPEKGCGPCCG
ncbi:hypothetical protein PWT90_05730 [Aphanocladium album]|nr:hypothetical protein PWT90_05730 [Aphanocladium album]